MSHARQHMYFFSVCMSIKYISGLDAVSRMNEKEEVGIE